MRNKALITGITLLVILIAIGGWIYTSQKPTTSDTNSQNTNQQTATDQNTQSATNTGTTTDTKNEVVILYLNDGFDKQSYTVKKGQTVRVVNQSTRSMQFSSDNHPTHLLNPELNLDTLIADSVTTFKPEKVGSWGIHDHLSPEMTTTLIVTE